MNPRHVWAVSATSTTVLIFSAWYWLILYHGKALQSIVYTPKVTPYGVYTSVWEVCIYHVWFLVLGSVVDGNSLLTQLARWQHHDRPGLEHRVHSDLRQVLTARPSADETTPSRNNDADFTAVTMPKSIEDGAENIVVAHSARTIFYHVIQTLLDERFEETGVRKLRIGTHSVQFGSFYRLLQTLPDATIEFVQMDFHPLHWTLDAQSVDVEAFRSCDLILVQHVFGVPLPQDPLLELGKRYNIPVMEDCVQSGSLYGSYQGHPGADLTLWSGGLDKIPSCLGGGFAYFRNTPHGNKLYQACRDRNEALPVDSWRDRALSIFKQFVHLAIAKNTLGIDNLLGFTGYAWLREHHGNAIPWYHIGLQVRKDKALAPFQHETSKFLRRPSTAQLLAMRYGVRKTLHYEKVARLEISQRAFLLSHIPSQYHHNLFPWMTAEVLLAHERNLGISEFTWVVAPDAASRRRFTQFLSDRFVIALINTTWEYNGDNIGKDICQRLVYLPNLNEMTQAQIKHVASVLTAWSEEEQLDDMSETPSKSTTAQATKITNSETRQEGIQLQVNPIVNVPEYIVTAQSS
jgi:hypothetical protein